MERLKGGLSTDRPPIPVTRTPNANGKVQAMANVDAPTSPDNTHFPPDGLILVCPKCRSAHIALTEMGHSKTRLTLTFWCDECSDDYGFVIETALMGPRLRAFWVR